MTALAHVGGLPIEEALPSLLATGASGLLVARAWFSSRVRRR